MSHDAESEVIKKLKSSRLFPGKTLKAIIESKIYLMKLKVKQI